MATATLNITIDDASTPSHPLTTVRDELCAHWNYSGSGTNADKIDFIELRLANYIKQQYKEKLLVNSLAANEAIVIVITN